MNIWGYLAGQCGMGLLGGGGYSFAELEYKLKKELEKQKKQKENQELNPFSFQESTGDG